MTKHSGAISRGPFEGVVRDTLVLSLNARAQRPTTANDPLVLVNADIVNVRDGRVTPNATIVLRDRSWSI